MGPEGPCGYGAITLCPSKFPELAEPKPLETDVAFVSSMVTRAARLPAIRSMFAFFSINMKPLSGKASGRNFRIWKNSALIAAIVRIVRTFR